MKDLKLLPVPNEEWLLTYNEVMRDKFIQIKYNREKRINEKKEYIDKYLPEIKYGGLRVLDLGPGPGEFLELCRFYGNDIVAIDSDTDANPMGKSYGVLSKLMSKRQNIPVIYGGIQKFINSFDVSGFPFDNNTIDIVNSQGSIEQIFSGYSDKIENNVLTTLRENKQTEDIFYSFFEDIYRMLKISGIVYIYGNGFINQKYYNALVKRISLDFHFKITYTDNKRRHKLVKE